MGVLTAVAPYFSPWVCSKEGWLNFHWQTPNITEDAAYSLPSLGQTSNLEEKTFHQQNDVLCSVESKMLFKQYLSKCKDESSKGTISDFLSTTELMFWHDAASII